MLPRDRVIQAINHQEPEYVPYGLHAVPAVWERVCRHYGLRDHHEAMAFVGNHIVKIGSDFNLQVFNPLSPTIMNPAEYKAKWGDVLTFYGGIDVERLMPFGTPDEIRREVRYMAETMGRGGGYILQTSHTILEDVPMANLVAFIEEVQALRIDRS